jgi:[protein-PII] uridylyltransferase
MAARANPTSADPTSESARPVFLELRAELTRKRAELGAVFSAVPAPAPSRDALGVQLGRANAGLLDQLLTPLWAELSTTRSDLDWAGVALGAVGSYGRGAVAWKSDLDVRLLGSDPAMAGLVADALLYPLWNMGVAVGHQVVTVAEVVEAARDDLPTATSLLDYRHVAGSCALSDALGARARAGVFAHSELPRFIERLEQEVAERHARFGGSVYLLEPDVKNGAGGLRDLDVAIWAAKARYGVGEASELVRLGVLIAREATELESAREMLWRIRNVLHAHAGRRSDRLTFDEQESLATILGYGEGGEAVEHLMSAYYRAARTISRSLEMILSRATPVLARRRPHVEELGRGVLLFDGQITLSDAARLRADPALALRLVSEAVDRDVALLPHARQAIARVTGDRVFCAELRANDEAARRFSALVRTSKEVKLRAGSVVRELHDLGLVLAMIPEFSPVVGRVHHDVYHVYTVDVHSVAAVDRLAALARGELAESFPLASRLAAEIPRPTMLYFATLLHDVGKAIGGKDHSRRGAEMARTILQRLKLADADIDEACHLIDKHLVMYHVATRRDLDDPATVAEFSREVHGRVGLRELYLLTLADLSTTSPTSMTSWKGRMLDDLYQATDLALRGAPVDDERIQSAMLEVARAAEELSAAPDVERDARRGFLASYLASMPERYVLANAPAAVAAHAEVARAHASHPTAATIALVPSRHPEAAELCIVAPDRPGLLAAITAAFAASRLEIHAAQIHSRTLADGSVEAVDLFWVRDRAEGVEAVARAIPKLKRDVDAVLSGAVLATELAHKRGSARGMRGTPSVTNKVVVDPGASSRHTVIEVTTRDRPGLVFAIADAIYRLGLTIVVAKINTEGTRVADVFYVSEADGSKVAPGLRTTEVEGRILTALEGLEHGDKAG